MAATKSALKNKIDAIFEEIDSRVISGYITRKQAAEARRQVSEAIETALCAIHNMVPTTCKQIRDGE